MCMVAAIIGETEAAPELIEMLRRQEFVFGGFYTGIVTAYQGKLYRKRSIGSVKTFISEHKISDLPGYIGFDHSRTDDGGGIEWAQPRFDENQIIATIGVGIGGVLSSLEDSVRLAEQLHEEGVTFHTRLVGDKKNGIRLKDNSVIHGGEPWLFQIGRLYAEGKSILESVREVNLRSESVSLFLTEKEPDRIFVANHNSRLVALKTESAMKLVSSCVSEHEKFIWKMEIPPNSFATVTKDQVALEVLWKDENRFDFYVPSDFDSSVLEFVKANPGIRWSNAVLGSIYSKFPEKKANLGYSMFHQTIEKLLKEGLLNYEIVDAQGVEGPGGVPQMTLFVS